MSQAYAFPPDTQIDDPCDGGRCHLDRESGTWSACRKHEDQADTEPCGHSDHRYNPWAERYECCDSRTCRCECSPEAIKAQKDRDEALAEDAADAKRELRREDERDGVAR